jgi:outer membrane protein TolC
VIFTLATILIAAPPPLRLEDILREVERRAPEIAVGRGDVDVSRAAVRAAGTWENPDLTIMAESVPLPGRAMGEDPTMITYRISQDLNVFGRRRLARQAASARVGGAQARLARAAWDARAQAVALFYDLWMNGEMQALARRQITNLDRMRESALARYRAGMEMGHHDVLRSEAEIETMRAELASLEEERRAMEAMLNRLRGRRQDDAVGPPELPPRGALPPLARVVGYAQKRPEVQAARWMRREAGATRDLARRMYWPMLMVEAEYEQRLGAMEDGLGGAVVLSVPLWFWDRPRAEVSMAQAMVRRADADVAAMASMAEAELRMAWSRARASERRLAALEGTAIPRMRDTVASTEAAYSAGSGSFLAHLDAILALLELEGRRLEALVSYETSRYELARLVGVPLSEMLP